MVSASTGRHFGDRLHRLARVGTDHEMADSSPLDRLGDPFLHVAAVTDNAHWSGTGTTVGRNSGSFL